MANIEDLRYIRTEEAIRAAFMELVAETPVSSLTASALCRRAGISRNAFYLHHSSVASLYRALVDELVDDLRAESIASAQRLTATGNVDAALPRAIVGAFSKHEGMLRALLPADDGSLAKQLAMELEDAYVDAAALLSQRGSSFEHRMNCAFASWAHVGLVTRWIAETKRPLIEALPMFESLQAGLSESATRFLTS
ncbi:MAG: TetR family transcriptional regulator [Eggerthellaceae bacterium]|nr:TetR family transcriptional regulator [Eggerthellaceae bacterium]